MNDIIVPKELKTIDQPINNDNTKKSQAQEPNETDKFYEGAKAFKITVFDLTLAKNILSDYKNQKNI